MFCNQANKNKRNGVEIKREKWNDIKLQDRDR